MNRQAAYFEYGAIPGYVHQSLDGKSILVSTDVAVDEDYLVEASDKDSTVILNPGDHCLHVKSQVEYVVLYWANTALKGIPVIVYQSLKDQKIWIRHRTSMFDGRFQPI